MYSTIGSTVHSMPLNTSDDAPRRVPWMPYGQPYGRDSTKIRRVVRGFVKLKKSKHPSKTRKWVGGKPQLGFFSLEILFFLCCFLHVKKMDMGVSGSSQSEFFLGFL